jgi:dynein light intermediate chain 1
MKDNNNNPENKPDLGVEGSNIWQEILSESLTKKDNEEANVFIFGDKSSGKKSLIRIMNKELATFESESKKLNIEENALKYGLINYSHLTVKKNPDDDSDTVNKIGVWIMNELVDKETFLSLIKPKDMLKCVCLVVVDYSRPWTIRDSLKKWADFIYEAFGDLILTFDFGFQNEMRKKSKTIFIIYLIFEK